MLYWLTNLAIFILKIPQLFEICCMEHPDLWREVVLLIKKPRLCVLAYVSALAFAVSIRQSLNCTEDSMDSGSHRPRSLTEVGSLILHETPALLMTISQSSGGCPALLSPDYLETYFILWFMKFLTEDHVSRSSSLIGGGVPCSLVNEK